MSPKTDNLSRQKSTKPRHPVINANTGRSIMRQQSRDEIASAEKIWRLNPLMTVRECAELCRIPESRLAKWVERGQCNRPWGDANPPKGKEKPPVAAPAPTPIGMPVLDGPVPTVDELREMVKKKIHYYMDDPQSVQQYASALRSLDSVRKEEGSVDEEEAERVTIYMPKETRRPPK